MTTLSREQLLQTNPLLAFSIYTHVQADYVLSTGAELVRTLDRFGEQIDAQEFQRAYGQFWLWILGAYEVVRTLDQHAASFAPSFAERVKSLKVALAKVRIPFAKQEYRGSSARSIYSDLSVTDVNRDLAFVIDGSNVSAKAEIQRFTDFVSSVRLSDITGPQA